MKYRILQYESGGYVAQFGRVNKRGVFVWSNLHTNHLDNLDNAKNMVRQHKASSLPARVVWEDSE